MPATRRQPHFISRGSVFAGAMHGLLFVGGFLIDVFSRAILLLKYPVSFVLTIFLLGTLLSWARPVLQPVFWPVCILPGISNSRFCGWEPSSPQGRRPDTYLVTGKHSIALNQMMGGGDDGVLSSNVTQTEITALVVFLEVSDLKGKEILASRLNELERDGKKAGRSLRRLTLKIVAAVGSVLAYNDQALISIADAKAASRSLVSGFVFWQSRPRPEVTAAETYNAVAIILSRNLEALMVEVEISLGNLQDIEDKLNSLLELLIQEAASISTGAQRDLVRLLATLTTKPREGSRKFDSRFLLLKELAMYRRHSLIHVVATLQILQRTYDDMEDIRERLTAPPLLGMVLPVEVRMKSIEIGLRRLKELPTKIRFD